jgi:hypothetical protein
MRVIDASWRRSVAGGVLLAAFAGQGLAAEGGAGQAAAGVGGGGGAGGFGNARWLGGEQDALHGPMLPAGMWRPTPSIHRALESLVDEFVRRGAAVRSQSFLKGTGVKRVEVRLGFTNTADTDAIDKPKIMERIVDAFFADMRRINKNHEAVLTCMLTFRDGREPCRLVTKKHRDRIVSLVEGLGEDKDQRMFQQRGADGKVVQQWDVTEDPKGENLPPEIRSDLPELVEIMETVKMGQVGSRNP